jgi:hypothetical protein
LQSEFSIMKSFLVSLIIVLNLYGQHGFITYPFISADWLIRFLDSIAPNVEHLVPTSSIHELDVMKYAVAGEDCVRKCAKDDKKVCYFKFTLRYYQVLGG